jgi:hypothetical protein
MNLPTLEQLQDEWENIEGPTSYNYVTFISRNFYPQLQGRYKELGRNWLSKREAVDLGNDLLELE